MTLLFQNRIEVVCVCVFQVVWRLFVRPVRIEVTCFSRWYWCYLCVPHYALKILILCIKKQAIHGRSRCLAHLAKTRHIPLSLSPNVAGSVFIRSFKIIFGRVTAAGIDVTCVLQLDLMVPGCYKWYTCSMWWYFGCSRWTFELSVCSLFYCAIVNVDVCKPKQNSKYVNFRGIALKKTEVKAA